LKLNDTYKLLVYADDVKILGGIVRTSENNMETLAFASNEIGLEVNADKTRYMVMSRDQNAGRNHNINIENSSLKMVKDFKYFGQHLKNQNSVQEEIKCRLKSGNICHHSVQELFYLPDCYLTILRLRYSEL
jgi:hypothetical protein